MRTVRQYIDHLDIDAYLARGGKLLEWKLRDEGAVELLLQIASREDSRRIARQWLRITRWLQLIRRHLPSHASDADPVRAIFSEEELRSLWRQSAVAPRLKGKRR